MTRFADWLVVTVVVAPFGGVVAGMLLTAIKRSAAIAKTLVQSGMLISFLAAIALLVLLSGGTATGSDSASFRLGAWMVLSGSRPLPVVWSFHADFTNVGWLVTLAGLSWLTLCVDKPDEPNCGSVAVPFAACLLSASAICFVLSGGLLQSLFFWNAISWTTLAMCLLSARRTAATGPIRGLRMGLMADIVLMLTVLLLVTAEGSDTIEEICSPKGVAGLGSKNPPLPGLIGCLLVISAIGRCGLFPLFGWHRSNRDVDPTLTTFVYAIGYIPSSIWLLQKLQPLLETSEVPMTLLGGLGTLGAVVGAFVACGQTGPDRLTCLVAAQAGIMLAALASGLASAAPACAFHQCSLSLAMFVILHGTRQAAFAERVRSPMIWCAVLSLSGAFPFLGGWSVQSLQELNAHPARWVQQDDAATSPVEADGELNQSWSSELILRRGGPPHWDWLAGLWIAQGLTAFAASMAAMEMTGDVSKSPIHGRAATAAIMFVGTLLLAGGLTGWLLGLPGTFTSDSIGRLALGQLVSAAGIVVAWHAHRTGDKHPTEEGGWGSIVRLSRQAMYIDWIEQIVFERPLGFLTELAHLILEFDVSRAIAWTLGIPAGIGRQIEALQIGWLSFDLAVILLGTATLLLASTLLI